MAIHLFSMEKFITILELIRLIKAGYSFSTSTDTEVINIAFHHWGIKESLQKFNGMWALAYFEVYWQSIP